MRRRRWPAWWKWELELGSHVFKRMVDRGFDEVEPRDMMERALGFRANVVEGRWTIQAMRGRTPWEAVVEPDAVYRRLVVVTACPVED